MAKRLVVCCDGTWNVADPRSGSPTNVTKIALNVAAVDEHGVEQRVFYDPGVGTGRFDRLTGGLLGAGLAANVVQAYRFVVDTFDPGDDLFLVGFSRGAFTARSVGGLIRNSGVLRRENRDRIAQAYRIYRDRDPHLAVGGLGARLFRRSFSHEPGVHCLGVFDTVGALGIPGVGGRFGAWLRRPWAFHDTTLGPDVRHAFQALAVDERRGPFVPAPWTGIAAPGQRVEQVWFRGCHSDVGGGYTDCSLAENPLGWMVARTRECGLAYDSRAFLASPGPDRADRDRGEAVSPDPLGTRHESRRGPWTLLPPHERAWGGAGVVGEGLARASVLRRRELPDEPAPRGFTAALDAALDAATDIDTDIDTDTGPPGRDLSPA